MNPSKLIATQFEVITGKHADNVAIHTAHGDITYRELDRTSNRIAHAILNACKSFPERVCLLFDQGADSIASTLAVLKLGAVFIPLDAADGSDRIHKLIDDCEPSALLTTTNHENLARKLSAGSVPVLCVDALDEGLSNDAPRVTIEADAMGSIFYTSGSTGIPKGVCQLQRNLLHFATVYGKELEVSSDDRLSLLYSPAFSASNMDVFSSLLNGATLCPYDIRKRGTAGLADWIDATGITVLHAVPTVFRHLAKGLAAGRKLLGVRAIDLGGEAVYPSDVDLFREHFRDDALFVNHLAATEASVIAQHRIAASEAHGHAMITVGFPAEGMRIRIVRPDGADTLASEPGEIVLSSPYISPGYFRRPELNAQLFSEDVQHPGSRTMRSGDIGYWDAEKRLCFLGRIDHRVKVRGHSVDLSEVETALGGRNDVRDVVVVLDSDDETNESGQLVMIVAKAPGCEPHAGDLRDHLKQKLPDYMMPARYLVLEELPSTTSGKVDRQEIKKIAKLATPVVQQSESESLDKEERFVAELFCSILNVPSVGKSDHFFALGGDSLRATQLHLRLEEHFQTPIALESLLLDPTVQGIANAIRPLATTAETPDDLATKPTLRELPAVLVPLRETGLRETGLRETGLRETGSKPPMFIVHGRIGQAFVSLDFLNILDKDQPVYSFQASGLDQQRGDFRTIPSIASAYISAMRSIQPSGPYVVAALCIGHRIAIEIVRQLHKEGQHVCPLLLLDSPMHKIYGTFSVARTLRRFKANWNYRFSDRVQNGFLRNLKKHVKDGTNAVQLEDTKAVQDAWRVSLLLEVALLKSPDPVHREMVLWIGSEERMKLISKAEADKTLNVHGELQRFLVADRHGDVLAPGNTRFAEALRTCMEIIYRDQQSLLTTHS
jgi:amino acid adenylation domain-containing protein